MNITTKITLYTILAIVASVSTLVYIDYAYAIPDDKVNYTTPFDPANYLPSSLKQQIDDGLSFNEILCPNNNHVLVERTNGKLACVYPETAEKFNWIIQDEEIRENLWLINHPAVKNCVPKHEGDAWPSMGYENSTHSFDVEFCEWILK